MAASEGSRAGPQGPLIGIVGPTATGKSTFALEVAAALDGEIISCDSMAVYRRLDIGTDKPPAEDRERVPHHLLDVAEPGTYFSAGAFRQAALQVISDIWSRGRDAVLVGGTGLYYRALTEGLVTAPPRNPELRDRLRTRIERHGPERLHTVLARFDPRYAATIGERDSLRIVRALEVFMLTGKPLSAWIADSPFGSTGIQPTIEVGLTASKPFLYNRIERRVEAMMARGLLEEVRRLREEGRIMGSVSKAIGYGELADHLGGLTTLEEAIAKIKLRSRHLAKRQWTWFKREDKIHWFDIEREAWKNDAMEFIKRRT